MNISANGVSFICTFEGFSANPYPDPASGGEPYTIGYGTTIYPNGKKVTMADAPVTKAQASSYIQAYVNTNIQPWLAQNLPALNQNQFDALCSFIYNEGLHNFQSSSLLKDIRSHADNNTITAAFNMWVNAGGHVMPGLVTRRAAEARLYCTGVINNIV